METGHFCVPEDSPGINGTSGTKNGTYDHLGTVGPVNPKLNTCVEMKKDLANRILYALSDAIYRLF